MVKIAVEQPFTDIQQALQQRGYQANMIDQRSEAASYDVAVVRNVESYEGFQTQGSLVETSGRTVVEVISEVEERLQRAGKTLAPATSIPSDAVAAAGGSGFVTGLLTGAVIGAATALFLAPKSGKEMQNVVKEKVSSASSGEGGGKLSQVKEKAAGIAGQVKDKVSSGSSGEGGGKLGQVKEKAASLAGQAKEQVNKVTGKSTGENQDSTPDTASTSTTQTPSTVVTTDTLNTSSTTGTSGTTGTTGTTGTSGASGAAGGSGTADTLNTSGTSGTRGGSSNTNNK